MRIGTWNLAGRWDARHAALLAAMDCDVLLLTEVSDRVEVAGMQVHPGELLMAQRRHWAAIAAPAVSPLPDPHGASAAAVVDGVRVCSSILPWSGCGDRHPWAGYNTASRTIDAVDRVEATTPEVWGGDWNHALSGREWAGSIAGRTHLLATLQRLGLQTPTALLPHALDGQLSIDHVAVPGSWTVISAEAVVAAHDGLRLSDHDAYVVEAAPALDRAGPR
jgi:endonuclease/exonuclease/phosphatase family metal-dependent hydrolase